MGRTLFLLVLGGICSATFAESAVTKIDFGPGDALPQFQLGTPSKIFEPIVLTPNGAKAVTVISGANDIAVIDVTSASLVKIDFGVGDVTADNPYTIRTTNTQAVVGIAGANDVAIIDLGSLAVTKVDFGPGDALPQLLLGTPSSIFEPIVLTPDGTKAIAAIGGVNDLAIIDLATASVSKIDFGVGDVTADNPHTIRTTNTQAVVGIAGINDVAIIDLGSLAVTKIDFGPGDALPQFQLGTPSKIEKPIVLTPDGTKAVVAIGGVNDIAVIDLGTASVSKIDFGVGDVTADNPYTIQTTNTQAVVGIAGANDVAIIDLGSLAVTKIDFGPGDALPQFTLGTPSKIVEPIVLTPDGTRAVAAIGGVNDVAVIDLGTASVSKIDFGVGDVTADNPFTIRTTNTQAVVGIAGANDVAIINLGSLAVTKIDFGPGDALPLLGLGTPSKIDEPIVLTPDGLRAVAAIGGTNDIALIKLSNAFLSKVDFGVGDVTADNPHTIRTTSSRAVVGIAGANDVAIISDVDLVEVPTGDSRGAQGRLSIATQPNPLRGMGRIRFGTPACSRARLTVLDLSGRWVRTLFDGPCSAGIHDAPWDGRDAGASDVRSGLYFLRLDAERASCTAKVLVAH